MEKKALIKIHPSKAPDDCDTFQESRGTRFTVGGLEVIGVTGFSVSGETDDVYRATISCLVQIGEPLPSPKGG